MYPTIFHRTCWTRPIAWWFIHPLSRPRSLWRELRSKTRWMICRKGQDFRGTWGAPTMMALEGGSFGPQIGGEATDFVLLGACPRRIIFSKVSAEFSLEKERRVLRIIRNQNWRKPTDPTFPNKIYFYLLACANGCRMTTWFISCPDVVDGLNVSAIESVYEEEDRGQNRRIIRG